MENSTQEKFYCSCCGRTMGKQEFYTSNNLEKYPREGKLTECRKCLTRHVDNWDPETYKWILEEVDVPYVPTEWNKLMMKYAKDPRKVTGTTIIGRYIGKMHLKQFKDYRYKDSEYLQKMVEQEISDALKAQGVDQQYIDQKKEESRNPSRNIAAPAPPVEETSVAPGPMEPEETAEDLGLTEADVRMLTHKWGKIYQPSEWIYMEQLFNDMMESYDIQSAGHIDTLKMICKASLKCNQLVDLGDKPLIYVPLKFFKLLGNLLSFGKRQSAANLLN